MATVEHAIRKLKAERGRIVGLRCEVVASLDSTKDKGEKRRLGPLLDKYDQHLQVIDYVLNDLETEEEQPCPD